VHIEPLSEDTDASDPSLAGPVGLSRLDPRQALRNSPPMQAVDRLVDRVAATDATVLTWGESGVGKELVARAIHDRSPRRSRPFIKVNCAALPLELLESELFGYERGAFTGAHRAKPGKFELADHGTMFLDEIAEMPRSLQAKLLHVLQDCEFSRLGSQRDVRVDVRVIAATNKDLRALVRRGRFREDLYYRLNVFAIHVPPLRERAEEIPFLVEHFIAVYAARYARPAFRVSAQTLELLMRHCWPGNIRELENVVKRMVVLGDDARLAHDLRREVAPLGVDEVPVPAAPHNGTPASGRTAAVSVSVIDDTLGLKEIARTAARDAERIVLERVLHRTRWNRVRAARLLKVNYKTLLQKIREHQLEA
jgi:transcriptional regulator with GAF, ATPase, and Fis domain